MNKTELVLTEIASGNYEVVNIAETIEMKTQRVIAILEEQIWRKKLYGEMDKENTAYIPGSVNEEYISKIRRGLVTQIIALLLITLTAVMFALMFVNFNVPQGVLFGIIGLEVVVGIVSLILSNTVKHTQTGKIAFILNWISIAFFLVTLAALIIIIIKFASIVGNWKFT